MAWFRAGSLLVTAVLLTPWATATQTAAVPVAASAIALDAGFGSGGMRVTPVSDHDDRADGSALQTDGKIVVAGWTNTSLGDDMVVMRYTARGSLDPTFDGDGIVLADFGGDERAAAVVIQPDGKIVVAGWSNVDGSEDFALARFTAAGALDGTFDGDGRALTNFAPGSPPDSFGSDDQAVGLALLPDNKLVVAGSSTSCGVTDCQTDIALARYGVGGTLDAAFDGDGKATASFGGGTAEVHALVRQSDGKLVVAGSSDGALAVARLSAGGTLDASFSGDGRAMTPFSGSDTVAYAVAQGPDGTLVAAGHTTDNGDAVLVRYTSNGTLDATFDGDGRVITDLGGDDYASAMLVAADGTVVTAGWTDAGTTRDWAVTRYLSDGSPDPAFGLGGTLVTDLGGNDEAAALLAQPDGKLVVAGAQRALGYDNFAVARYGSGDGSALPAANRVFLPLARK